MSSDASREIIDAVSAVNISRCFKVATATILFYDYFLTLADEVKYTWQGKKSWVFAIFLTNRYLPIGYQIWSLYVSYSTKFHQWLCDESVFWGVFMAIVTVSVAQVVLTLRIYAVTKKNRVITSCFCAIAISQFSLGLYTIVYTATRGAETYAPIPLPAYTVCFMAGSKSLDVGLAAIALAYDFLAFSVIICLVVRSNVKKVPISGLLRTIVRDATYYFLFIFTSHLVLILFLLFASPSIQLLPVSGTIVFLPVMITRLMLSLKKSAAPQEDRWSLGEPTVHTTMRFAERRGSVITRDEIRLDTFGSTHEGTQGRE